MRQPIVPGQTMTANSGAVYQAIGNIVSNFTLYVATTGNDTTGTGAASTPFATIQKAMSYLQNFHIASGVTATISVGAGTFAQTAVLALGHEQGDRINLTGTTSAGSSSAITSVNTTTLSWVGTNVSPSGIQITTGQNFGTISNFYILGGTSGTKNTGIGYYNFGSFSTITMCRIEYWSGGLSIDLGGLCNAAYTTCANNTSTGYSSANSAVISAYGVTSTGNAYGLYAYINGRIRADGSPTITNNTTDCAYSYSGGFIYLPGGATLTGNGNSNAPSPAFNTFGNNNGLVSQ